MQTNLGQKQNSLLNRYEWSLRYNSRGYEGETPKDLYHSLLADGPIGAVDKITRRARVKDLPIRPRFLKQETWDKSERKSGEDYLAFGMKPDLTPSRFHIRRGKIGALYGTEPLLYLELVEVPWQRGSLLKPFADCLVELAEAGFLDLGPTPERRSRAYELLKTVFRLTEVEFRVDLPIRESSQAKALLTPYYDPEKGYSVCSWVCRFKRGYHLKVYERGPRLLHFLRVEMVFYFPSTAPEFKLPLGSEAVLKLLWPRYVANLKNLRRYGRRPEMAQLIPTLLKWRSLRHRIQDLDLYAKDVSAMCKKNQGLSPSERVF
jgi:hypothetical protein